MSLVVFCFYGKYTVSSLALFSVTPFRVSLFSRCTLSRTPIYSFCFIQTISAPLKYLCHANSILSDTRTSVLNYAYMNKYFLLALIKLMIYPSLIDQLTSNLLKLRLFPLQTSSIHSSFSRLIRPCAIDLTMIPQR